MLEQFIELIYKQWDDREAKRYYPGGKAERYNLHPEPSDTFWERHCEHSECYETALLYTSQGTGIARSEANSYFASKGWRIVSNKWLCPTHNGRRWQEKLAI